MYIHIPFCRTKCRYCDFYSVRHEHGLASRYVDALCLAITRLPCDFSTVYIGGGTPTVLSIRLLGKLLRQLRHVTRCVREFTVEANPESIDADKLRLFLDNGVNRLSVGVQSFCDVKLKMLGRIHSASAAIAAVMRAKKEGFENIGIDVMFGFWQETLADWRKDLSIAVELPVRHISAYALTYEKNTPLFKKLKRNLISPLDDDLVSEFYQYTMQFLPRKGFLQYEVSNFAKNGYSCEHNERYWRNEEYTGLGPSAVSYAGGIRTRNTAVLSDYMKKIESGESPVVMRERLSKLRRAKETASLKIRTAEGIDFDWFVHTSGFDFRKIEADEIETLVRQKLITYIRVRGQARGIRLTRKGFLFCDTVSSSLL